MNCAAYTPDFIFQACC